MTQADSSTSPDYFVACRDSMGFGLAFTFAILRMRFGLGSARPWLKVPRIYISLFQSATRTRPYISSSLTPGPGASCLPVISCPSSPQPGQRGSHQGFRRALPGCKNPQAPCPILPFRSRRALDRIREAFHETDEQRRLRVGFRPPLKIWRR